ncbi:hypothetical protein DE146DRAFT_415856 [Phaeosphaeria sp. MPI-PUGE-AT-0046c]|nr:hypothetical protein DE146DRAFT_415856 [Phaeosphaeria sp. MPI-PUGE-AT-0046c]
MWTPRFAITSWVCLFWMDVALISNFPSRRGQGRPVFTRVASFKLTPKICEGVVGTVFDLSRRIIDSSLLSNCWIYWLERQDFGLASS